MGNGELLNAWATVFGKILYGRGKTLKMQYLGKIQGSIYAL